MAKHKTRQQFSAVLLAVIATALVLVFTVMVSRGTNLRLIGAWDCVRYNFTVQQNGDVYVHNASANAERATKADVSINGVLVAVLDAPATPAYGQPIKIGTVTVPSNGVFTWMVSAHADRRCTDNGSHTTPITPCNYVEIVAP